MRLAADGVRYAKAFAQASWTRPSFATIFTGLYPSSHGAVHKADALPSGVETVAEALAAAGYTTAGIANNANISPAFNFGQGFQEYRYLAPDLFFFAPEAAAQLTLYGGLRLVRERFVARSVDVHNYYAPAETVTADALAWLDGASAKQRPFFLFLHYMDPHDPYFVHPFNGEGYARVANPNPQPGVADTYRRLYDGEITYLDEQLGVLIDGLRQRGLYDGTLIVLTGDHGEEFQEHGGWWHGTTLYDEQTHVPLIIKPPLGGARGRVVDELAMSLDIAPTILAAAGTRVPAVMQGHALPLDERRRADARPGVRRGGPRGQRPAGGAHAGLEADHGESGQPARAPAGGAVRRGEGRARAARPGHVRRRPAGDHASSARARDDRGAGARRRGAADGRRQRHAGAAARPRLRELSTTPA